MSPKNSDSIPSSESYESSRQPLTLAERRDLILNAWIAIDQLERAKQQIIELIEKLSVKPAVDLPAVKPLTLNLFELSDDPGWEDV